MFVAGLSGWTPLLHAVASAMVSTSLHCIVPERRAGFTSLDGRTRRVRLSGNDQAESQGAALARGRPMMCKALQYPDHGSLKPRSLAVFDQYISYYARQYPQRNAIVTTQGRLTFAEMDVMIDGLARVLADLPLDHNSVVAIQMINPVKQWLLILGLARLGIPSACAADTAATFRIGDQSSPVSDPAYFHASDALFGEARSGRADRAGVRPAPARLGRVLLSSGTTRVQKRIGLTWALIDKNIRNAVLAYGPVTAGPWLFEMVADSVFGFTVTLAAWSSGQSVLFRDRSSLADVLTGTQIGFLAMVPIQLQQLLAELPQCFKPLPSLRAVTAGGLLPPAVAREARVRLTPDLMSVYGASECGVAAIAAADHLDEHPGSAGYAFPGVSISIVDEDDSPLLAGEQGRIRIASDRVVGHYLGHHESPGAFRDGYFYTGDLGRMRPDGLLLIEGREDDLMNLGGPKLLPSFLEAPIRQCPGILDVAVFAVPKSNGVDECWAALVHESDFDYKTIVSRLQSTLQWYPVLNILKLDELPRNQMGKVRRSILVEMVGQLK